MSGRFVFPLRKALDWYRQILAAEKEQFERIVAEIRELDRLVESLERKRREDQQQVQGSSVLLGWDLVMLSNCSALIREEVARIRHARLRKEARLIEQRQRVVSSRRRVRLFESLEQRRRDEWLKARSLEENALASELYLAAMVRQAAEDDIPQDKRS